MKKIFWILTSVLLLASCEKQSELVISMNADVNWQTEYIPSGTNVHFIISSESQTTPVQRILLTSSDAEFRDRTLLDTVLAIPAKKANVSFYSQLPYYKDSTVVTFFARSYDQAGNTMVFPIIMHVLPGAKKLREIDAVTMYSAASSGKSAFSLESMQPVYIPADSTKVGWFDLLTEESKADKSLARIWTSKSGIRFSRSEGYNYSEATALSLQNAWPNQVKSETIKNLKADDVILFGKPNQVIGVMKILAVFDEADVEQDRYIFSLKVIE